jgi:DNA-binding XRE family transcriptional regulator
MPRPKPTKADLERREHRQHEWTEFRKEYMFTQVRLAELLGVCRRTVQLIEAGKVTPLPVTLRRFLALKARYKEGQVA